MAIPIPITANNPFGLPIGTKVDNLFFGGYVDKSSYGDKIISKFSPQLKSNEVLHMSLGMILFNSQNTYDNLIGNNIEKIRNEIGRLYSIYMINLVFDPEKLEILPPLIAPISPGSKKIVLTYKIEPVDKFAHTNFINEIINYLKTLQGGTWIKKDINDSITGQKIAEKYSNGIFEFAINIYTLDWIPHITLETTQKTGNVAQEAQDILQKLNNFDIKTFDKLNMRIKYGTPDKDSSISSLQEGKNIITVHQPPHLAVNITDLKEEIRQLAVNSNWISTKPDNLNQIAARITNIANIKQMFLLF